MDFEVKEEAEEEEEEEELLGHSEVSLDIFRLKI